MFEIGKPAAYDFPVEVRRPSETNPGQFTKQHFNATFAALPVDEGRALVKEVEADRTAGGLMSLDKELLRRVVRGWKGVKEEFGPEMLEAALDDAFILAALMTAYRKSLDGEAVQSRRLGN